MFLKPVYNTWLTKHTKARVVSGLLIVKSDKIIHSVLYDYALYMKGL